MDRQATQPAAVPSGRKRRRVGKKQKQEEEAQARALQMKADHDLEMAELGLSRAELLEMKAKQPPTSELVIACLLYTSPSPRDGLLSRMPSSA